MCREHLLLSYFSIVTVQGSVQSTAGAVLRLTLSLMVAPCMLASSVWLWSLHVHLFVVVPCMLETLLFVYASLETLLSEFSLPACNNPDVQALMWHVMSTRSVVKGQMPLHPMGHVTVVA